MKTFDFFLIIRYDPVEIYIEKLRDGVHLEQPPDCSDEIYSIMEQCWRFNPNDRPAWAILVHQLHTKVASKFVYF